MSAPIYRPDYAKFALELPRGLFRQYYQTLNDASHKRKFYGDWLKSHKVQALPSIHPDLETTVVEIWGEWAGVVRDLPFEAWGRFLRRFDVRAAMWDADGEAVKNLGVALVQASLPYNVELFHSKPASKRLGRDRGGEGFRIGSRKSDVCSVVYKRGGEPVAHEIRLQGQVLRQARDFSGRASPMVEVTVDAWQQLIDRAVIHGQARLTKCLEHAGVGTYWPSHSYAPATPPLQVQAGFAASVEPTDADLAEYATWAQSVATDEPQRPA